MKENQREKGQLRDTFVAVLSKKAGKHEKR